MLWKATTYLQRVDAIAGQCVADTAATEQGIVDWVTHEVETKPITHSGMLGRCRSTTSPSCTPRAANPWATVPIRVLSSLYLIVRPVGPSTSAGLSPNLSKFSVMYSVKGTVGSSIL